MAEMGGRVVGEGDRGKIALIGCNNRVGSREKTWSERDGKKDR